MNSRLRWRRKKTFPPVAHELVYGDRVLATAQRSERGWFWYGMQRNTAHNPRPTIEEAKADAETVARDMLRAADAAEAARG